MAASLENAGVCILSATAPQPQVDAAGLQAKGLRVRTVSTCVADVLLASASLAMLVIPSADLEPGAADADRQWDRCQQLTRACSACEHTVCVLCWCSAPYAVPVQIRCRRAAQDILVLQGSVVEPERFPISTRDRAWLTITAAQAAHHQRHQQVRSSLMLRF